MIVSTKIYFLFSYSYLSNNSFEKIKLDCLSNDYKIEKLNDISVFSIFGVHLSLLKDKIGNYFVVYPSKEDINISSHYNRVQDIVKKYNDSDNLNFIGLCYNNILYSALFLKNIINNNIDIGSIFSKIINKTYLQVLFFYFIITGVSKRNLNFFYFQVSTNSQLSYKLVSHLIS